jgi:SAM-dependent methyltransferase
MTDLINKLHKSKFLGAIFPTLDYCLQKELADCESVLDLGCGPSSPLQYCQNVKHSVGVEAFGPYLEKAKEKKTHTEFLGKKIEEVDFPENSFDAVIMIEVLEHLPKDAGLEILKRAEKWARKKVVVTCPNGFLPQKELDGNPMQKHLSGWKLEEMEKMGFVCRGLAGLKSLRQEVEVSSMGDDMTTTIKFRPKIFWFAVATISQIFTFYFPRFAFELFSVKKK